MSHQSPRVLRRRWIAVLPLLAAFVVRTAWAGVDSWTPIGPGEANLVALAASSRGDLYATAAYGDVAEVWQLPAGATVWRWRSVGLGRPQVVALAAHPTRPDQLWAISGGAMQSVYRSDDAGASWRLTATASAGFAARGLWVVPAGTATVLIADTVSGDGRKLARSNDGGVTWSSIPGAAAPVAVAADLPGVVYAAAEQGGVLRSHDRGLTFRATRSVGVAADDELRALHVTRGRRPMVFASFRTGGLFRSTDGKGWERVGFGGSGPTGVVSSPDVRTIHVIAPAGFYTSKRSGRPGSFRLVLGAGGGFVEPTSLVMTPGGPLFVARGSVLGPRSAVAETGIQGFTASEVRIAEAAPSRIALRIFTPCTGTCGPRTFLSADGGVTFVHHGYVLPTRFLAEVWDLAFDPVAVGTRLDLTTAGLVLDEPSGGRVLDMSPIVAFPRDTVEIAAAGALLVGGPMGVQVSRDGGATWTTTLAPATADGSRRVIDLRVDPGAPGRLLALALETATGQPAARLTAFRSIDAGANWAPVLPTVTTLLDVEAVPGSATSLFVLVAVAGGSELRRTDDGGVTSVLVHTFSTAEGVSDFAVDAVAPGVLYAASATGVLRSRDGGATWEATAGSFAAWGLYRQRLARLWVDPSERGHIFAAPADGGLFENRLSD